MPNPGSCGLLEEDHNNTPGVLDIPPFGVGSDAGGFLNLYLQLDAPAPPSVASSWLSAAPPITLHNDTALVLEITNLDQWPPQPGNVWHMQNVSPVPLLNEDDSPSGYAFASFDITFTAPAVGGTTDLLTTGGADGGTPWALYGVGALALAVAAAFTWRRVHSPVTVD